MFFSKTNFNFFFSISIYYFLFFITVALLLVIESCIVYNAALTLQMLEQANATQQVFTMWMQPGILAGHEEPRSKRLCALALMCLLRLPSNAVPTSIRSGFNQIFIKTIEILSNLEQQRSELEEEGSFWDVNNNSNGGGGTLKKI